MISNQDLYNRSIKNNLEQTLSNNLYNHAHHYDQPQHYYDQLYHQQQYHYEYQQQQQQQQYHHLIDTASHQSFTYGRQPRQDSRQLPPLPPSLPSPNPISRLASALQSNQQQAPGLVGAKPKRVCHHRTWKKKIQLIYDYKHAHFISFLLFLILILVLIVIFIFQGFKFAMLTANHHQASRSSMIPLVQVNHQPESPDWENYQKWDATTPSPTSDSSSLSPDVLSSKLLIGEFVILSQNYTNSATRKSVLAENIVKLMDQVFLSTDMRRLYSRMNVLDIRPHVPSGIIVKCNIILSESIIYAAQQFGFALYDSLARSNEKLANQPGFIIDKNSIRFNSVRYAAANQAHNHQPFSRHTVATTRPTTTSRLINLPLFSLSLYRKPSSTHAPTAIPDKDLSMLPNRLLPEILAPSIPQPIVTPPSDGDDLKSSPASAAQPSDSPQHDQDVIGWSEWSAWSSCVDKNGICDSTRLHSRIRMCVMKDSGVQIDSSLCRQRFSVQDLELEVTDCSSTCANSAMGSSQSFQSDAPLVITPNTAPSIMLAGPSSSETPSSTSRAIKQQQLQENNNNNANHALAQGMGGLFGNDPTGTSSNSNTMDNIYAGGQDDSDRPVNYGGRQQNSGATAVAGQLASLPLNSPPSIGSQENGSSPPAVMVPGPTPTTSSLPTVIQLDSQQQQMSCSNCTSDEICLLLVSQKVPFCAKIKDRQDLSGCGGWCKADDQICQPVGQNAFKCSHNSECLPGEWRCHDSQCIPASKRCDGHENCFDSSDERYCPSAAA